MYQKLLNTAGECLIISNFINAANIGKNFSRMFHNSRGANKIWPQLYCDIYIFGIGTFTLVNV